MSENLAVHASHAEFIRRNTQVLSPPLVPEIELHLASEVVPIWHLSEEMLAERGLPAPFWAFAWAGGQALARHIIDHSDLVRGRRVFDFGAGSGLVAIAAALGGAAHVTAADIDPFAMAAIKLNGALNGVEIQVESNDQTGRDLTGYDIILAADICYEQPAADRVSAWLRGLDRRGIDILIGDPGRTYLPCGDLEQLATYAVQTTTELEDCSLRHTGVWKFRA